ALAELYVQAGNLKQAASFVKQALEADPEDFKTRIVATRWAVEVRDFDQARQHAAQALKLNSGSPEAILLSGIVAMFLEDFDSAVKHFQALILVSPGDFTATDNLALALCQQDNEADRQLALSYAQLNAQRFPQRPEAAATLGWVLLRLDRVDEAEKVLRGAASASGLSPNA
ncbi:MAG: tetratricopeptide repeat protein, partial [Xanthomonadales bacterium]|nr:tetratricopeptide repeat protein [Xanthomonadales bacterium]